MAKKFFAQLSLEFLLLLCLSLSLSLVFFVALKHLFFTGLFALDVQNASAFLLETEKKSETLSLFGEGSFESLSANFFTQWELYSKDDYLFLEVTSKDLNLSKKLLVFPSVKIISPVLSKKKKLSILIERNEDFILIKDN